jgi:hypothetical protein
MTPARQTVPATTANDMTLATDDLARKEIGNVRTGLNDFTDELVTDDHGSRDSLLGPGIPLIDVEVRAADARAMDSDEDVIDTERRTGDVLELQSWRGL